MRAAPLIAVVGISLFLAPLSYAQHGGGHMAEVQFDQARPALRSFALSFRSARLASSGHQVPNPPSERPRPRENESRGTNILCTLRSSGS